MNKKGLIIFDLDGVIINSENNMKLSWTKTAYRLKIKKSFNQYRKFVGLGFFEILKKLKVVKKKHQDAFKYYNSYSLKYVKKIKAFKGIKKELKNLEQHFYLALFTSKNKTRVSKILKKENLKFKKIITLNDVIKSKPNPEGLLKIIKSFNFKKKNIYYLGDTYHDLLAAKRAGISYYHCNWGFFKIKKKINYIDSVKHLSKIFINLKVFTKN